MLTWRIEHADALGLSVLEAGTHDDETTNTISQLFDGMIRIDDDGSVTRRLP